MPRNLQKRGGVYYARIQVAGRERRRSLKTGNEAEAKRRLKIMLADLSPYHGSTRQLVEDVIDSALASIEVKPKTLARYVQSGLILARHFEGKYFDQVTKQEVIGFIKERKLEKVTVRTIKNDLSVLSIAAEHAIECDWIGTNPVTLIGKRHLRAKQKVFVLPPPEDIELLLASVAGPLEQLCRFYRHTGMRRDEGSSLTWHQVDTARRAATLTDTKNGLARTVSLNDEAIAILASIPPQIATPVIFTRNDGEPYTGVSQGWREGRLRALAKKPNMQTCRLHDLRHIYAIEYLRENGNLYALQKQLGHGSIRQTEWYLQFLTPEEQEAVKSGAAQNPSQMHRFSLAEGEEIA